MPDETQQKEDAAPMSASCTGEHFILNDPNYEQDRVKHATLLHDQCPDPKTCGCEYHGKPDYFTPAEFAKEIGAASNIGKV